MMTRWGYTLLFTLCIYCLRDTKGDDKTDQKIKDIFGEEEKSGTGTDDSNDACECVDYFLCNGTHINTNGEGVIDIRGNDNQCDSYLQFCCKLSDKVEDKIVPLDKDQRPKGCGYRNAEGVGFRTEGDLHDEAKFGEFPWMAAVLRDNLVNTTVLNVYQCGGSIIHPQAVITAAHCIRDIKGSYTIRAGEWDTQTEKELLRHQNRRVKSITIHPDYYAGALYNDVALLILETPLELDDHIDIACLPPVNTAIPDGQKCWASGWGKDLFGAKGKYQVIMKKVGLPFVNRAPCQESMRTTRLGRHFKLHESFVCAGGVAGVDTCQGDGGSPLVCPIPGQQDRYQQVGIVAWGIGCGEDKTPGVYANVVGFRNWLDAEMAKNNLETSQYQY